MTEIISTGIVCPLCGRKEATIEKETFSQDVYGTGRKKHTVIDTRENIRVSLIHPLCGYKKPLEDYIKSFFPPLAYFHDVQARYNRVLEVTAYKTSGIDNIVSILNKVLEITNGYFTTYTLDLQDGLVTPICPICQGTDFIASENTILCKEKHFSLHAIYFFISTIKEPFKVTYANYRGNNNFIISRERPYSKSEAPNHQEKTYSVSVAHLIYHYNEIKKERTIIVEKDEFAREKDYRAFLNAFKKSLDPLYTIIEKIKSE